MASIPRTIAEFSVLPVEMPAVPSLALPTPAMHFLYVRRHAPKRPATDDERSLFMANVPVDATAAHFRALFASLVGPGRFESVVFEEERRQRRATPLGLGDDGDDVDDDDDDDDDSDEEDKEDDDLTMPRQAARLAALASRKRKREGGGAADDGDDANGHDGHAAAAARRRAAQLPHTWTRTLRRSGSTAVALLADAKSVDVVLKAVAKAHKAARFPAWPAAAAAPPLGAPWLAAHNRLAYPDREALLASVDAFFALFNEQEAAAAARAKQLRNVPDADGFVTVTRASGSRSAPARQEEATAARAKQLAKQARQRADMADFYRFQLRERKKDEQAQLQRRFQEDAQRISALSAKRGKFQPEA